MKLSTILPSEFAISAVSAAELLFGVEAFGPSHPISVKVLRFVEIVQIQAWPADAAAHYARIRHHLRQQPIGEWEMMIAAHALAIDATFVTNKVRHFTRIGEPLRVENWLWVNESPREPPHDHRHLPLYPPEEFELTHRRDLFHDHGIVL